MIWNHPVETTIKNWLFWSSREIHFQNPSFLVSIIYSSNFGGGVVPDLHFSYIHKICSSCESRDVFRNRNLFTPFEWSLRGWQLLLSVFVKVSVYGLDFWPYIPKILYTYISIYHISICRIKYDLYILPTSFPKKILPVFPSLIPGFFRQLRPANFRLLSGGSSIRSKTEAEEKPEPTE